MRVGAVLAMVLLVGCGGGGGTGDGGVTTSHPGPYQTPQGFCAGNPKLSGGDLIGTWTIIGACGISTGAPANCANTTVSLSLEASGTVTFNADKTGSMDVTLKMKKTSTVALSCPSVGDCASLQSMLALEAVGPDAGAGAGATCAPSSTDPTRCACEQDYSPAVFGGSGTYRFELPNYIASSGSWSLQGGYAVQGNTLRLDGLGFAETEFDLIAQR
jgi:hypothetical protein